MTLPDDYKPSVVIVSKDEDGPAVWRCGDCLALWMVSHSCSNPPNEAAIARAAAHAARIVPRDSPRWCEKHQTWGDHLTDRCPENTPPAARPGESG